MSIFKPKWPKWKVRLVDFFMFNIPGLHVGTINKYIDKHRSNKNVTFIKEINKELGVELEAINSQIIPKSGPVTFISNHPGAADVLVTIESIGRIREDISILANSLVCIEPVIDIVIPVDKLTKKKKSVDFNQIDKAYEEGRGIVFYAAGQNSRYNEQNQLVDRRWRSTCIDYTLKYKSKIVVMHIGGANSSLFYKVANFRKRFKALKNIPLENIFQLREFVNSKGVTSVLFSDPIEYEDILKYTKNGDSSAIRTFTDNLYDFSYELSETMISYKKFRT